MTPIVLLECLEEVVKEKTKDIILQVRTAPGEEDNKERAAYVYKMQLPREKDKTQKIPYILLQVLNGSDDQEKNEPEKSTCKIRMVFATYSEDGGQGSYDVLNLILRVRSELEKVGIIGGKFTLQKPLEYIIYPDSPYPYYIGEMVTNWSMPTIKREVEQYWQ